MVREAGLPWGHSVSTSRDHDRGCADPQWARAGACSARGSASTLATGWDGQVAGMEEKARPLLGPQGDVGSRQV